MVSGTKILGSSSRIGRKAVPCNNGFFTCPREKPVQISSTGFRDHKKGPGVDAGGKKGRRHICFSHGSKRSPSKKGSHVMNRRDRG